MLKVGDTAPSFAVQTHEGQEISLASLQGKKVVLWFYPKAGTPG
jgi:peroxiredoxin Q/BCP